MNYWLFKSDPEEFGWEDLKKAADKTSHWDGVRNYQARNNMRQMRDGDLALFYHSIVKPQVITGIVKIVREAYPDFTQFDPANEHYDPKSSKDDPRWFMVDVRFEREFDQPLTIDEMKEMTALHTMALFRNSRLSVQPVTAREWKIIMDLAGRELQS